QVQTPIRGRSLVAFILRTSGSRPRHCGTFLTSSQNQTDPLPERTQHGHTIVVAAIVEYDDLVRRAGLVQNRLHRFANVTPVIVVVDQDGKGNGHARTASKTPPLRQVPGPHLTSNAGV